MNYPRVASRYSKALLELAIDTKAIDAVNKDAAALQQTIRGSRELALLLKSPVVKSDKKQAIMKEIFGGKFSDLFEGFVMLIVKNGREGHLDAICEKFQKDVLAHKGIVEAEVTTAVALSDEDKSKLIAKLKSQLGKEVVLQEKVDAAVMGGMKLFVEGYQLDNTISGKLRALRHSMLDKSYQAKN